MPGSMGCRKMESMPVGTRRRTAKELRDSLHGRGVESAFTLAFSLRCGSTVLSNALGRFGIGRPTEYFQYPYETNADLMSRTGRNFIDRFEALVVDTAQGGIFGSKMTHDHRAHLDARLSESLEGYRSIDDALPSHKWLLMSRQDTIAQAISLHVAEHSQQWHVPAGAGGKQAETVPYDFLSILSRLMIIGASDANWEAYFRWRGIRPHRICYESLVAEPRTQLRDIFRFLGVTRELDDVDLERDGGLRRVADVSAVAYESLRARFLDDFLRIGQPDDLERLGPAYAKWCSFFFSKQWNSSDR